MALLSSCANLSLTYTTDFCMLLRVRKEQEDLEADTTWIIIAFFLGLILGVGLVLILARPCIKSWDKKKKQDEENLLETSGKKEEIIEAKPVTGWITPDEKPGIKKKKGFFRKPSFFKKKKGVAVESAPSVDKTDSAKTPLVTRGMADILVQTNSAGTEVEMASQDMAAIKDMESDKEREKEAMLLKTLDMLLRKKMEKRAVTENFYVNFMKKTGEEVKDLNKMISRERAETEEKLLADPKLAKDPQALETELEKQQGQLNNKQTQVQREYKNHIRHELLRSSGMSEAEVDELMDKLMKNMAFVEEKIGLEQARQRRALEQRLAKRRQAVEFQEAEAKEAETDVDNRVDSIKNLLTVQPDDTESRVEKQKDEIIADYANDLENLRKFYAKEFDGQVLNKLSILENFRRDSLAKLEKKQEKEKAAVIQTANKKKQTDFIKVYHDLMVKHHMEKESLNGELDQREVQELHKLKQDNAKERAKAMDAETEKMQDKMESMTDLTSTQATKIIKLHKQDMANLNARRQKEKQAMIARLNEQLQQRLAASDEAEARDQSEQEALKEEQMTTLKKVLTTNMDLTEEAKQKVLEEHEQNMQALSNQMLNSKLRQQKSLEIKLNQRRMRLAELKQKKEEMERSKKLSKIKEKQEVETKLLADIAAEEASFEDARKEAVADLRRRLSEETNEALKQQDEEIGLLIGRLQIGQARRKAILEKQDAALKQLQDVKKIQDELEKKVTSSEVSMPGSVTDQLLQQHHNQIAHSNQQLQRRREFQEKKIMERLARKKTEIEIQIETQLEEDAQREYTDRRSKGAGYASLALMQSFLEQRHTKAMQDLEVEMQAELEKAKSDINAEMELELKKDLDTHKQNLLTQLAAVSKMSRDDLQEAVHAATHVRWMDGQTDNKAAQKLAKDLRDGVHKARSSMDYQDYRR